MVGRGNPRVDNREYIDAKDEFFDGTNATNEGDSSMQG